MKYAFYIITGLLALAAIWRIALDRTGQPARVVFDTPTQPLTTRTLHPAGAIPYGEEPLDTGTGAELFSWHCSHCHGSRGNGQSYTAQYPGMPAVGNLQISERPAAEWRQIIQDGRGAMPAFRNRLRAADIENLLQHIHTLRP